MSALQAGSAFKLRHIRQVTPSTAVASIEVGPITIGSVWINDCQGSPEIAWPRSMRGYPVVTIEDDHLRRNIEAGIISTVRGWGEGQGGA